MRFFLKLNMLLLISMVTLMSHYGIQHEDHRVPGSDKEMYKSDSCSVPDLEYHGSEICSDCVITLPLSFRYTFFFSSGISSHEQVVPYHVTLSQNSPPPDFLIFS